jgi:hypothetical protein
MVERDDLPSTMQSGSARAAVAIAQSLGVQSRPLRVFKVTLPLSIRI